MKFYDFIEKQPKLDGLIVIEGTDGRRLLVDTAPDMPSQWLD